MYFSLYLDPHDSSSLFSSVLGNGVSWLDYWTSVLSAVTVILDTFCGQNAVLSISVAKL